MLTGVLAFNVLKVVPHDGSRAIGVLLTGYIFQGAPIIRKYQSWRLRLFVTTGLGFFMTFFFICIYILRIVMVSFLLLTVIGQWSETRMTDWVLERKTGKRCFHRMWSSRLYRSRNHSPWTRGSRYVGPITLHSHKSLAIDHLCRLPRHNFITSGAGDVWFAGSVMGGLMLFGLALFFFAFSALPWWRRVSKRLHDVLGRASFICLQQLPSVYKLTPHLSLGIDISKW